MKNRITPILVTIIVSMALQLTFGQDANSNYAGKKSVFWKQYKEYINNLKTNTNTVKPTDPSGLFYIDARNNFNTINGTIGINDPSYQNSVQIGQNRSSDVVSAYSWTQTSGTYTSISGTQLGTSGNDDEIFTSIPIGFTFMYDGVAFTTVGISNNGYLRFGATPSNYYSTVLAFQTNTYAGFNADLIGNGTTSKLEYSTTGSAPNRQFVVQWTNNGLYNGGPDGSSISYQMVLNESTNKIQTVFGPMTVVTIGYSPQCGINTATSDFNIRTTATDWSATTAGATNSASCLLTNTIKPASGLTWTWGVPPLCGTYTIPGSYATVAAAVNDLNSRGVCGTGPVTFNIATGYTETIPPGGYVINITGNMPTAAGPVIFQRSAAGTNPLLSSDVAGSGTIGNTTLGSDGTAFFKLVGTDYITFSNISLQELYTGATQALKMQYGFMMVRASSTDGCKNVTINGCIINMQQSNISSSGIATLNLNAAGIVTPPTTTDGRHQNISVQGCTINNSFNGMYFLGGSAVAPYDLYDHFYNIGTITGNTLSNIGSVAGANTATHYGIYAIYLDSLRLLNNTINVNRGLNSATQYGIFTSTGTNSSVDITNNTISDTADGTVVSSSQQAGIYNTFGASGTDNRVNITNNTVRWCRYFSAGAPSVYYIANLGGALTVNITGNTVDSNTIGGESFATATGTQYGIYQSASNTDVSCVHTIANNTVRNITRTQSAASSGVNYGIYISSAGYVTNINNNTVKDLYNGTTTSALAGIYCPSTVTSTLNVFSNSVSNLTKLTGATSGPIYGIYSSQSTPLSNAYNNNIFNLNNLSPTGTGVIYGYYNFGSPPSATGYEQVYGNTIHDISHQGTTASTSLFFVGIYVGTGVSPGLEKSIHDNQIYNVTTNYGQTGGIYVNYADTARIYNNRIYNLRNTTGIGNTPQVYGMLFTNSVVTSVYYAYNNFVSELYADANPTFPAILGMWQNNTSFGGYYYNTIYLDATSTGANFGTMGLYLAGATTMAQLKNNIVVNNSTFTGTGGTVALYRGEGVFTYYDSSSNNNNYYAGTPSASNLIYIDPVNQVQTMSAFKTLVAPRESNSGTENSPFTNVSTHPYNLHMLTNVGTICESGGIPITSPFAITTDYDGNTRNVTTPDIGADEFNGILPAIAVNMNIIPGGFYNTGTGRLNMRDSVKAYLVDSVGCLKKDSAKGMVDSVTFAVSLVFPNASNGNYYLVVKHRNSIVIASRLRQVFTRGATLNYSFVADSSNTFGNNVVKVSSSPVRWGMIPGDANQDQFVDGLDQTTWILQNGLDGYRSADFNGDSFVDGLDQTIWILYNGNSSVLPCAFQNMYRNANVEKRVVIDNRNTKQLFDIRIVRDENTDTK